MTELLLLLWTCLFAKTINEINDKNNNTNNNKCNKRYITSVLARVVLGAIVE